MKIIVASSGRAHLLDCARELYNQGHDVLFYSFTYKRYMDIFDFPRERYKSLLWIVAPFLLLDRKFHVKWARKTWRNLMDIYLSKTIPRCDVFIAQSPLFSHTLIRVKKKYNAITILDRGTSHVRKYNQILKKYISSQQPESYQKQDENQYKIVDYITIASDFVRDGFIEFGVSENKIFVNPYGVLLNHFSPTKCTCEYDVIMVGQWSKRKGCHIVVNALKGTKYKLLHVGSLYMDFPNERNFFHQNSVQEIELINYYSKSKVFLFPSIEDGFGLVLTQAVACGLPIVCSKNCGGPTLKKMIKDRNRIFIMEEITEKELLRGIEYCINIDTGQVRNYQINMELLSWNAYGKRYNDFLTQIKHNS